jgi:hypothetical protein
MFLLNVCHGKAAGTNGACPLVADAVCENAGANPHIIEKTSRMPIVLERKRAKV